MATATNTQQYRQGWTAARERMLAGLEHMTMGEITEQGTAFNVGYSESVMHWEMILATGQQLAAYWEAYFSAQPGKQVPSPKVAESIVLGLTEEPENLQQEVKVFRNAWKFRVKELNKKQARLQAKKKRPQHAVNKMQPKGSWNAIKKGVQA